MSFDSAYHKVKEAKWISFIAGERIGEATDGFVFVCPLIELTQPLPGQAYFID